MADKLDFDPYEMMEVNEDSTEKEIVSAFKKMALKWHPDKNPTRVELANEMFLKIQKAFAILTDAAAKSALDRLRKAKKATKARNKDLDEKRRKLKEDLESREQNANVEKDDEVTASEFLEAQIERLRKEGSKLLQKQKEEVDKQIIEERLNRKTDSPASVSSLSEESSLRLKVRWKVDNAKIYTEENLRKIFEKYGLVTALVVSKSAKKGSALVEFADMNSARLAVEREKGNAESRLEVSWISSPLLPPRDSPSPYEGSIPYQAANQDFESHVLTRMKQAEERMKLIEQMTKSDNDVSVVK